MAGIKTLGNHGLAYLLTKGAAIKGTTASTVKGTWYLVVAQASGGTSSLPVRPGLFFCANAVVELKSGDEAIPLTKGLLGFARGKGLNQSKNVVDATTDSDAGIAQQLSDGIVTSSGSISGYNEIPASGSAQEKIMKAFQTYVREDTAGTLTVSEMDSEIMLLMIDWTARRIRAEGPQAGEVAEIDIMPVVFTSKSTDSDYGSPKGFNVDFAVTSRDDDGAEPMHYVGVYIDDVVA